MREAWQRVVEADALARDAAALVADTTAEHVAASKDKTNAAVGAFADAQAALEALDSAYADVDLVGLLDYVAKRIWRPMTRSWRKTRRRPSPRTMPTTVRTPRPRRWPQAFPTMWRSWFSMPTIRQPARFSRRIQRLVHKLEQRMRFFVIIWEPPANSVY